MLPGSIESPSGGTIASQLSIVTSLPIPTIPLPESFIIASGKRRSSRNQVSFETSYSLPTPSTLLTATHTSSLVPTLVKPAITS